MPTLTLNRQPFRFSIAAQLPEMRRRVYARHGAREVARIAAIFGLNKRETAELFGVTRQSVDEWYERGVPMRRVADVARVADLARMLHTRFRPERLPQIVREAMPGIGNVSILEAIRTRGVVPVLDMLDRAFSYIS